MLHRYRSYSLAAVLSLTMSQISDNWYKEWLGASIKDGSIACCPENDITLNFKHIGSGAFGVVYKANVRPGSSFETITKTMLGEWDNGVFDMTVAVKILHSNESGDCEEDLHRQFVKEVTYFISISVTLHSYFASPNL